MKLRTRCLGKPPSFTFGLILLVILACVGVGLGADTGSLPPRNWNLDNLKRIKVPTGEILTFAVLGDNRSNPAVFEKVLKHLDRDSSLDFAIDLGDLVETGNLENFRNFLDQVRQHLRLPFITAIGNHDLEKGNGASLYQRIFGPDHYTFQIKGNYFIVVNDAEKTGLSDEQWGWLEEELQKSRAFKTRLVFLHTPLFDPREGENHHALSGDNGRRLVDLFRRYHVTYVFAAHIHGYFSGNWDGIPYTITGGAGAPLYGTDPQHYFYHYLKVTLRDDRVHIEVQHLDEKGPS